MFPDGRLEEHEGRVCVVRQHAQGVGRGDRRMRGDAERALGLGALRRPLYFVMTLASVRWRGCVARGASFPDGRRVVSASAEDDNTLKV